VAVGLAASVTAAGAAEKPRTAIRVFKPAADTYATAASPRTNFGRSRVLRVDAVPSSTAYVRFKLTELRGVIDSVTLLLHPRAGARTSFAVRPVRNDFWEERGLTYRNAPRPALRYAASHPVRRGAWSAVDVTPFVTDDEDEVSLAITTRSALGASFASRETLQGPRLVVRHGDG
jgi:hypothetical protein